MCYSAAWTDSGFLLACSHEHETREADSCIPCAGGYVGSIENGVMRSLTPEEEAEFQRVRYAAREAASPIGIKEPRQSVPPQREGETLLDYVLRFLSAFSIPQPAEAVSDAKPGLLYTGLIDLVLSRLREWETSELERMYGEDRHALLEAFGNRFRQTSKP